MLPDQAPEALQLEGELVVVQARLTVEPEETEMGPLLPLAVIFTVGGLPTLTVTESRSLPTALVQVIVKVLLEETVTL